MSWSTCYVCWLCVDPCFWLWHQHRQEQRRSSSFESGTDHSSSQTENIFDCVDTESDDLLANAFQSNDSEDILWICFKDFHPNAILAEKDI